MLADGLRGMAHVRAGVFTDCDGFFASLPTVWAVILLFLPLSPEFGEGSEALT